MFQRQSRLIDLVTEGMNNREIAEELGITYGCVKHQLREVLDITGMSNRLELALWRLEHNLTVEPNGRSSSTVAKKRQ
jgi:DNA-binding NarL/FixJ family response regulator